MANVYLDTTFLTGYFENQNGRREAARAVIESECEQENVLHTSILTVNEFCSTVYDRYRSDGEDVLQERLDEAILNIRRIAQPAGFTDAIMTRSAYLMSCWGERHKAEADKAPKLKHCRWDAIHIATADVLKCVRAHTWDRGWNAYEPDCKSGVKIMCPPAPPQPKISVT